MTTKGDNEYDQRKATIDYDAAEAIFDRHFALGAFKQAMPPRTPLPPETVERIRRGGHLDLARSCLAYVLTVENAPDKPEQAAFLACIRRIRDSAREMASAADAVADQLVRHESETGLSEPVRSNALSRLADALHGRFRVPGHEAAYFSMLLPWPVANPFSGNRMSHGLTDCAAVYNEANAIIAEYRESVGSTRRRGMRAGNRSDRERQTFVSDLADIYRQVMDMAPKAPNNDEKHAPFVRFVIHVFDAIAGQDLVILDRYAAQPPSVHVIRTALKGRDAA